MSNIYAPLEIIIEVIGNKIRRQRNQGNRDIVVINGNATLVIGIINNTNTAYTLHRISGFDTLGNIITIIRKTSCQGRVIIDNNIFREIEFTTPILVQPNSRVIVCNLEITPIKTIGDPIQLNLTVHYSPPQQVSGTQPLQRIARVHGDRLFLTIFNPEELLMELIKKQLIKMGIISKADFEHMWQIFSREDD